MPDAPDVSPPLGSGSASPPDDAPAPGGFIGRLSRNHPGHPLAVYRAARRRALWALAITLLLASGIFLGTDLDQDGLPARHEFGTGASLWHRDTDGDTLADGKEVQQGTRPDRKDTDDDGLDDAWETVRGFNPLSPDSDQDGVDDLAESIFGTNPHSRDTDDDGLDDREETAGELLDCDSDQVHQALDADDDNDGRIDGDEPANQRCQPDVDGDSILDGLERAQRCITSRDCDEDGLEDGTENETGYDPLDPDTFETKILDGVVYLFESAGQAPSPDADEDGIPDGWEDTDGLITWGQFNPTPGTRDLLVEFVRVQGPDSARYAHLDFTSSYTRVADFFATSNDVRMQWVETRVNLPKESRPPLIPSSDSAYYADVLSRARFSDNPYVSTVVMNPQHDQKGVLHLGVAPIRGMLAGVDYGAHVYNNYQVGANTVRLTPLWESIAQAGRIDVIQASGWNTGGINSDGDVYLEANDFTLKWRAFWFATPPTIYPRDGSNSTALTLLSTTVDRPSLEHTILHELGHNLGLCHTELADCRANLTLADQRQAASSTMYSGSAPTLHFLDSQWTQIDRYLTCPPQPPLAALAAGADRAAVIASKYDYQLQDILNVQVRQCGDLTPIPDEFGPSVPRTPYQTPSPDPAVNLVTDSVRGPVLFVAAGIVLALIAAWLAAEIPLRRRPGTA